METLEEALNIKRLKFEEIENQLIETKSNKNFLNECIESNGLSIKPIHCKKCNLAIAGDETLEEHVLKLHSVDCHKCNKTFNSEQKLKLHISFDHSELGSGVSCQNCEFLFPTQKEYEKHLNGLQHNATKKTMESEDSDSDDEYIDICGLCGIILHSYEEVDDHQSNYLRCEECFVCFHNEFQWNKHENCDR